MLAASRRAALLMLELCSVNQSQSTPPVPYRPSPSVVTAVLLVDHGSRRQSAHQQLTQLAERLAESMMEGSSKEPIVEVAHMEIAEPSITVGFARCVQRGAEQIVVLPCLLSRGRHVSEDIPACLVEAAKNYPHVPYKLAPPLLEHPGFVGLLRDAAQTVMSQ